MDRFFYIIYQFIDSKKLLSFGVLCVFIFFLIFIASKIEFEEDITKLIPINDKNINTIKVLKTVNFDDKIIVNISKNPDGSVEELTQYAKQFIDTITKTSQSYIKQIQGKIKEDDIQNTLDFVYKNLPLFLDENDYKNISNSINKDSIDAITLKNYKILISPSGIVAKNSIIKDPLGLSFIALKKFQQLSFGDTFVLHDGFLVSKDKNHLLLFITPALESNETAENSKFIDNLYHVNTYLNKMFKGKVQSEYFGSTLIAVANAKQIKYDIKLTVGIAISILLIILIYFYKKFRISIILFLPTFFGGLLAVALLYIIRTKISAISLGIGSVLIGVTLDYSLHILTHIRGNKNVKTLYKELTKPILMSSLTTALVFLCLFFLDSEALQDLGIFAAISVIGASFFALIFIPHIYIGTDKDNVKRNNIDTISAFPIHKNKWVIMILVILFFVSFFTYNNVNFNKDLAALNYEPQHIKEAQLRLDKLTNSTSKSIYLSAFGNSEQDALSINDNIYKQLKQLKANSDIINFSSIGALIQSEVTQKKNIEKWNLFWTPEIINNTKYNLIESGRLLGFKPETFNLFYSFLSSDFKPLKSEDYKALKMFSMDDYISTKESFTTITTTVKIQNSNTKKIVKVFKENPNIIVIDRKQMNETLLGNLKNDFNSLIGYSLVVVLLILLFFYRSFSLTLITSIPICLTWLLTIGAMGAFNVEFNIFNVIIAAFIFGLCIDYSIFITNGLLHEYRISKKKFLTAKTSIFLSVITTILGFGVLLFAKHPALNSISVVSIIGILSAIAISFTIQPLLFKLFIGSDSRRPTTLRQLIHSFLSFFYFGIGSLLLSIFSITLIKIIPVSKKHKMGLYHKLVSKFMKSVLYTNPFVSKKIFNSNGSITKQSIIIANHTSFLDILAIGMLYPKIIFLVNNWVYNSPFFGKVVQLIGYYPLSSGIEKGIPHLRKKVQQGYTLMTFPEGTRSYTNKIKRFHKGAFYLAEKFNLDIIPVLIHGNSEVLPKGDFVIKDGAITLKILDRIKADDLRFGKNYSSKTKNIGTYFKDEFKKLRNELEKNDYFHKLVLQDYIFKGDSIYKTVKEDLKVYAEAYKVILDVVDSKDSIIHLSKDYGQLDYLLTLDSVDRETVLYIENRNIRTMLESSFIRNNHSKIICEKTIEDAMKYQANVIIINLNLKKNELIKLIKKDIELLILLKENLNFAKENLFNSSFEKQYQNKDIVILKRTKVDL